MRTGLAPPFAEVVRGDLLQEVFKEGAFPLPADTLARSPVFHDATALDTTVNILDPQPAAH